ncbi:MAG TPA: glycosyltransferase family 2 protein [Chitinophagaceae bacterium]|nr:glycosyltransferase family 2 protein [Chitinophagaceae bacterium]
MPAIQLSVIIPIYNEALNIPTLYKRLKRVMLSLQLSHELIFVNDCSRDESLELIRDLNCTDPAVKFIDFSRNFGHQLAVTAGLAYSSGDAVAIIDADLQDPPELIADLYKKMNEGFEVVYAKRKSRKDKSVLKKAAYKTFYRLLARISQIDIPLDTGDFRILKRCVVKQLNQMPEQHKFLRGQIAWLGFKQSFIEYDREARAAGEPGYSYRKLFRLALDGITSFSNMPLRVATLMGFVVFFISLILMVYTLVSFLFFHDSTPRGWSSIMISVLFIGGIQLLSIGIIGEYISRILSDVRKRPLFVVRETNLSEPE